MDNVISLKPKISRKSTAPGHEESELLRDDNATIAKQIHLVSKAL